MLILISCKEEYPFYEGLGKKPVYISYHELGSIGNMPPQPIQHTGTIFWHDTLFFLLEQKKGVHVFDIRDTTNPVPLTFIKIPAVSDFTVNGHYLYADNGSNLVTLDISDLLNVRVVHIQAQVFQPIMFPPQYTGYFECVDTTRGIVVDWIDAYLYKAACQIVN